MSEQSSWLSVYPDVKLLTEHSHGSFICFSSMLYPKVLACLTEMRTMTEEYSKQILQIQDIQPNVIPPLMVEMVSKSPINDL